MPPSSQEGQGKERTTEDNKKEKQKRSNQQTRYHSIAKRKGERTNGSVRSGDDDEIMKIGRWEENITR